MTLLIDTRRIVETPEGVELAFRIAGPVVRALAWSLDVFIRFGIYIVAAQLIALINLDNMGVGLLLIGIFVMEWFYPVYFEIYHQGATPGKKALKIKVLHDTGRPVDWSASMLRNLIRTVDFLPLFYGFGLVSMLLSKDFKRLGDIAANTVVVYADVVQKTATLPEATPLPINVELTLEEQKAIIKFAERADSLHQERREELAELLAPIIGTHTGKASVERLYQIANSLMGR